MSKPIDDRYQNQSWYVRWWRCRHYLGVPWQAWKITRHPWVDEQTRHKDYSSFKEAWSIAIGLAQGKMEYYYTWDEVKARLSEKHGIDIDKDDDDDDI